MTAYTFDQLITFTRTSAATYVGSNGLVAVTPASRNLLIYTQEFDNAAWTKTSVTATANTTTAPDGTLTADTLQADGTASQHYVNQGGVPSGTAHVFSIYAKAGTDSFLNVQITGANLYAQWNVSTGALVFSGAGTGTLTATAQESVGNGWYRLAVAFTQSSGSAQNVRIHVLDAAVNSPNPATSAAGNVLIWGAQLEAASAASTYTRNNGGVYPPRFDYDPVTRAPRGLLIEEQRTNLLTYSEQFDNAAWTKSNATVTADAATSPDGTADADRLVATTTGAQLYQIVTLADSTTYAASVYLKKGSGSDWAYIRFRNKANNNFYLWANLATGVVGSTSGSPTSFSFSAAGNGWYRLSVVASSGTGATTPYVYISSATGDTAGSPAASDELLVWGAQLEAGAFATSYIPTVASQVTRTADVAAITAPMFAPWYNQSAGSFVAEVSLAATGGSQRAVVSADLNATNNESIRLLYGSANTSAEGLVRTGSSTVASITVGSFTAGAIVKMAVAATLNSANAAANNAIGSNDTSLTMPTPNLLNLGYSTQSASYLNGHIRSIDYYPTRLTNAQIQALTA